jgi:hypothetical protein
MQLLLLLCWRQVQQLRVVLLLLLRWLRCCCCLQESLLSVALTAQAESALVALPVRQQLHCCWCCR